MLLPRRVYGRSVRDARVPFRLPRARRVRSGDGHLQLRRWMDGSGM